MAIKHTAVATGADDPSKEINKGEWNADHTIDDGSITYAKIQNVTATARILGRVTAAAGVVEELTAANVKTILALSTADISGLGTIATQAANNVSITGGAITGITDLAVADGGTGASTAGDARTNLGLGTIATQAASSVALTGGSITGLTAFGVRSSGSGAFDLTLANTENLAAGRTLTIKVNDAARTLDIAGNLTLAGAFITSGANSLTLTTTGATNVTLPTTGTLAITANVGCVQRVYSEYTTNADLTTVIPYDDTIPQITEGTEILTAAITPKSASNRIRIRFQCWGENGAVGGDPIIAALFVDATAGALCASAASCPFSTNVQFNIVMDYEESAASITARTYRIRVGPASAQTIRLNGKNNARRFGGVSRTTMIVEEVA